MIARQVYVISDLHIGGAHPDPASAFAERQRGFRMMTRVDELTGFIRRLAHLPDTPRVELVINGDFIDFLAEESFKANAEPGSPAPPRWKAFRGGREEALDVFRTVIRRDGAVFKALRELIAAGKTLTLLLGNHDIELSIPDVRSALEHELGRGVGGFRFIDDGQALDLGEALIDHGNLFDPANVVDHDKLRMVRALYSRGYYDGLEKSFSPPAGSRLVAEVMNPIKAQYGFIDLLKPESEPLFALLLAIEPRYKSKLKELAAVLSGAARTLVPRRGAPVQLRNVSGDTARAVSNVRDVAGGGPAGQNALDELLEQTIVEETVRAALTTSGTPPGATPTDVAGGAWSARWSLVRMLIDDDQGDLTSRLPQVQATLRVLQNTNAFVRDREEKRYLDAAGWLAERGPQTKGYRAVVFGHTHQAKEMTVPDSDVRYFNTGTWANLMRFPAALADPAAAPDEVTSALATFAHQVKSNQFDLFFSPTYVRLDLDEAGTLLETTTLREYDWQRDQL